MAVNRIKAPYEKLFVKALAKAVTNYFKIPENQEKYKAWYLEKYGVPCPKEYPKAITDESEDGICETTKETATVFT